MNKKELFTAALKCREGLPYPPLWELEFHLWDAFSGKNLYVGEDFVKLTRKEKETALHSNLQIFAEVSDSLGFSGINTPGKYWEIAPGLPAYFWMPEEYRKKQIRLLRVPGKGFVFGGSNAIQKEIPKENYKAMLEAYQDYITDHISISREEE